MADLIPAPDLEIRDEERLAAEAIGYISGPHSVARIDSQIEMLQTLRALVESNTLALPVCAELTNANPSSPHTVFIEAMSWLLAQIAWRINLLPKRDQIEFARLFKIELREARPARATLRLFIDPPEGEDFTLPEGTEFAVADGSIIFKATAQTVVPFAELAEFITVEVERTVSGETVLAPNTITRIITPIAWLEFVTNPEAVSSGSNDESIEEALERARNYQQRGERWVSTRDLEQAILEDVLLGSGIVRAFPFVSAGDFSTSRPGHTTVIVMTKQGEPVDQLSRQGINAVLEEAVGNQFVYVLDPIYITFNVTADVRLRAGATQTATGKAIETNLKAFYAASRENFGRGILRSEVITVIEGSPGVDRIVAQPAGPILASPEADVRLDPWQLPNLMAITINFV